MKTLSSEDVKRLQLEMLGVIDSFCKENSLRYFLTGGSLLGAVRHNGFIPWDDDIDIAMPRRDYEFFLELFHSFTRLGYSKYDLVSIKCTPGYYLPYAKMVHKDTVLYEEVSHPIPIGIFIDIFPLDSMPSDYFEAVSFFDRIGKYRSLLTLKNLRWNKRRSWGKNLIVTFGHAILSVYPRSCLLKRIDRIARTFEGDDNSKYICNVVVATYGQKEIMERAWFSMPKGHVFERLLVNIPSDYHRVLSNLYGDYMQLPPEEKRVSHHSFLAYWR